MEEQSLQPVFLSQCYATSCLNKRDWSLLAQWAFPGCHCSRSPSNRPCNVTKEIGDLHVWFWVRRDKEWYNGAWHVLKLLCHLLDHSSASRILHGHYYEHLQRETHSAGRRRVRPPQSYKNIEWMDQHMWLKKSRKSPFMHRLWILIVDFTSAAQIFNNLFPTKLHWSCYKCKTLRPQKSQNISSINITSL